MSCVCIKTWQMITKILFWRPFPSTHISVKTTGGNEAEQKTASCFNQQFKVKKKKMSEIVYRPYISCQQSFWIKERYPSFSPQEWTHICREWTIKAGDTHGFSSCYKQHRCIMAVVSPPVIGCASHRLSMSWSTENVAAKWGGGNQTGKKKVKWGLLWHNDSSIGTRSLERVSDGLHSLSV